MQDLVVRQSAIHGRGVFAVRDFQQGEQVLKLDDSRIVDNTHPLRPERGEHAYHCDYLANGRVVLMGKPERYINSSCDPNTYVRTGPDGAREAIALCRIEHGEEILFDYIINCHGGAVWHCTCGSARCRGTVPSSFVELPLEEQRRYLPLLDAWFVAEHRGETEAVRGSAVNHDEG
jgi:SET domain-containing protein